MKTEELLDNGVKGLLSIMEDLSNANHRVAVVYAEIHGDKVEMEDNRDYIAVQRSIQTAIRQIGYILGNNLSEKFF